MNLAFWRRKDPIATYAYAFEKMAEFQALGQLEDALLTEYLRLPNRPTVKRMMRETEVSEPREEDCMDFDDWEQWRVMRMLSE